MTNHRRSHEITDTPLAPPGRDDGPHVISTRVCDTCDTELPLTATIFDRDRDDPEGFFHTCKMCRSHKRKREEEADVDERILKFERQSMGLLEKTLDAGTDVPHQAELFQEIIKVFGGVGGFAGHTMAQYLSAKRGGSERTKILSLVLRMADRVSESGLATIPVEMLSDDELNEQHAKMLRKLLGIPEDESQSKVIGRIVEKKPDAIDVVPTQPQTEAVEQS